MDIYECKSVYLCIPANLSMYCISYWHVIYVITIGVKSGRADTFDPSVFQSTNHVAGVDSDKGLFVDRNKRELQIAEVDFGAF